MEEEEIIRNEAHTFFWHYITADRWAEPHEKINELRIRLYDFYSREAKAKFLDEIEIWINVN